jgi:hypothetical protein
MSLTAGTIAHTTPSFRHPYMSYAQARWIFDLINSRTRAGTVEREGWRGIYLTGIVDRASFEKALSELRQMPKTGMPETASVEGLYLDPTTMKLYRLALNARQQMIVSVYSETAARRIDLATGKEVKKGTWTRMSELTSRTMLSPTDQLAGRSGSGLRILSEWRMTDSDKIEYVTGICNFCYRGLKDARSVRRNYGPDCATKYGLPWGD